MSKPVLLTRVFSVFIALAALFLFGTFSTVSAQTCGGTCVVAPSCNYDARSPMEGTCGNPAAICCSNSGGRGAAIYQPEVKVFVDGLEKGINDPKDVNKPYVDDKTVNNMASWVATSILGGKPIDKGDGLVTYSPGLVGGMGNYMALMMGNPPATTQTYVADVFDAAGVGIAQPAYAQGLGFSALDPILETWKIFRNVAYFFFVIIIVVIGFMIMFRQKIQGQTVVTAQQAIPNIVIALIAVTFSYALAGLLIDIMYVSMFLLVELFGGTDIEAAYIEKDIFSIGFDILKANVTGDSTVYTAVGDLVQQMTGTFDDGLLGDTLGFLGGITFLVVFAVALAIGIFRLFFALLRTYLEIIISIVTAPLILMLGAIPGRNTFGPWVKNLVGLLASFPVVLLTLIIFNRLSENYTSSNDAGFLPPFLIGQGSGNAISTLISLGFILIMPEVVKQAQKAMGVGGGVFEQFGNAMSDAVKKGWTGGELIPGVGLSDTRKWPLGGLSGQNFARKAGIGTAAAGGALYGGVWEGGRRRSSGQVEDTRYQAARDRAGSLARWIGSRTGDPNIKQNADDKKKSGGH